MHAPRLTLLVGAALLGCVAPSCASAGGTPSSAPTLEHAPEPFAPKDGWSDLSYEERHEKMTFVVHPALARRFKTAGSERTAKLTCESCHGERAEAVRYRMPAIEALRPSRVAEIYRDDAELSPLLRFMRDEVTPTTARLMDLPVYDPATGEGFSCFNCHLKELE
jgi:cytochrome c553